MQSQKTTKKKGCASESAYTYFTDIIEFALHVFTQSILHKGLLNTVLGNMLRFIQLHVNAG